ncbi:MAG: imidazolonepropionase [Acidobacteriota bacterium]
MRADFVLENIGELVTPIGPAPLCGPAASELRVVPKALVASLNGRIVYAGTRAGADIELMPGARRLDARGKAVLPGFVDCHTHLPFAGDRSYEFLLRMQGKTYQEIAAAGGGINSTVKATREASEWDLQALAESRVDRALLHGTTAMEAKSGYGLDLENELKQLRVCRKIAATHVMTIIPTCMCAHDFPPEYRLQREKYVEVICEEILPEVRRQGLADFFDVFVEEGVYTRAQATLLCTRAKDLGFQLKIHADELSDTGGAGLAAELGAISAEHLLYASKAGIREMAAAHVVAVLLPGVPFFLMMDRHAPARAMIEAGVAVALATDLNPGSSYTESMPAIMQLACFRMKLKVEEALVAATLNAARAIRRDQDIGSIEIGKQMDAVVLNSASYVDLIYHFGVDPVASVIKGGRVVVQDGWMVS